MTIFVKHLEFIITLLPPTINFVILSSLQYPNRLVYLVSSRLSNYLLKITYQKHFFGGELMNKIDDVLNYNEQHQLNFANSKRKLPNVDCVFNKSVQTQTEFLPTCTIDRFYSSFSGGLYGEFSKILDILNRGYCCLHVDNSLILINFKVESKPSS